MLRYTLIHCKCLISVQKLAWISFVLLPCFVWRVVRLTNLQPIVNFFGIRNSHLTSSASFDQDGLLVFVIICHSLVHSYYPRFTYDPNSGNKLKTVGKLHLAQVYHNAPLKPISGSKRAPFRVHALLKWSPSACYELDTELRQNINQPLSRFQVTAYAF